LNIPPRGSRIHSSQAHTEHSPGYFTKQVLTSLRIEIIPIIPSDHNGMKLNQQVKNWKIHKHVEIKQHTPEQPTSQNKRSKGELENILRQMKMKTQHMKT